MSMLVEILHKVPLRPFLISWTLAWVFLAGALIVYWHSMPVWISWPLAIIEAVLAPDPRVLRKYVFRKSTKSMESMGSDTIE
jgi:hypothetical protein